MDAKVALLTTPQREDGGRTALDRFDYQTTWGMSLIIDLHEQDINYAVGFEFHDDIISLDNADAPQKVTFYQVKTRASGNLTFSKITEQKTSIRGKKDSFAGKMFDHVIRFGSVVEKLVLVSNQPLAEIGTTYGEKKFNTAQQNKLKKFVDSIKEQKPNFIHPMHTGLFFFIFSDLNLSNYQNTILGKIANFLEKKTQLQISPKPFALTFKECCKNKSKSIEDIINFNQLKTSKFITYQDMKNWLTQTSLENSYRPQWKNVENNLKSLTLGEQVQIKKAWRNYETALISRYNAATIEFRSKIKKIIEDTIDNITDIIDLLNETSSKVAPLINKWEPGSSTAFIKAAILYEYQSL